MSKIFDRLIRPCLFRLAPETAHEFGVETLRIGLGSRISQRIASSVYRSEFSFGPITRFGLRFDNPLGIAAGFDKNGLVVDQLAALGFGFVEVGTVTFRSQPGNAKPRLFRLPEDEALINRFGFNNDGAARVVERLKRSRRKCVIGVNIGKNKDVPLESALENYLESFRLAYDVADYVAINVSSPNTPNLRELQRADSLLELLGEIQNLNRSISETKGIGLKPLLVKIAPDLDRPEIESIAAIAQSLELSGIIATNTTVSREGLKTVIDEAGGLSGRPVRRRSTEVIRTIYEATGGALPIIGVGGVFCAADAFEKIAAGASLVQAYTGFIYRGPSFAREINDGLSRILVERGFSTFDNAVGSGVR